jgi:hypothetical protein
LILMPHQEVTAGKAVGLGSGATPVFAEGSRESELLQTTSGTGARAGRRGASHGPGFEDRSKLAYLAHEASPPPTITPSVSAALHLITLFSDRIQGAALLLSAAFLEAGIPDFVSPSIRRGSSGRRPSSSSWYEQVVGSCLVRSQEVRSALRHRWEPTPRAERLATEAFVLLTDLTPAREELLRLCRYDRTRAFSELAKHLDLVTDQFRLSASLFAEVEAGQSAGLTEEQRFADTSAALLERAGGGVSLTEGAELLGTTRQALHKRIKKGSALGMMKGTELVLPRFQFVTAGDKTHLIDGLSQVVRVFDEAQAGGWSALQFLVEADPNLGDVPIRTLSEGRVDAVVNAARAFLGSDEG